MRWFVSKLRGWLPARRPNLRCAREVWRAGVAELERRTLNHTRESGAYLLGLKLDDGSRRILQFVYYDDIDPLALASGVVVIRQTALPKLWALCRQLQLSVVADVHVHPGSFRQSQSDRENPVMPRGGTLRNGPAQLRRRQTRARPYRSV